MDIADGNGNIIVRMGDRVAAGMTFIFPVLIDDDAALAATLRQALEAARHLAEREGRAFDPDRVIVVQVQVSTVPA